MVVDPHADDYFARAARRLGALSEQQLAEIRHLRKVGQPDRSLSQVAFENAYLDSSELFSVLREADRVRGQEAAPAPRSRAWIWLALSVTGSVALLLGFVAGLVLSPDRPTPPVENAPAARKAAAEPRGAAQPSLDMGDEQLRKARNDRCSSSIDPHKLEGTLRAAVEYYTTACALDPTAQAFLGRGQSRAMLGDLEKAEQDFTKAIEIAPTSSDAWYQRGSVRFERSLESSGLWDISDVSTQWRRLAVEDFQKASEVGLKGPQSLLAEAVIAWQNVGIEAAYVKCTSSIWETASSEELHRFRGELFAAKGDYVPAQAALARAIELRAHYPEALLTRALVRCKLGQHREAVEDFTACIERGRFLERALNFRGECYFSLARYNSALSDWRRCLDISTVREARLRERMREAEARTKF